MAGVCHRYMCESRQALITSSLVLLACRPPASLLPIVVLLRRRKKPLVWGLNGTYLGGAAAYLPLACLVTGTAAHLCVPHLRVHVITHLLAPSGASLMTPLITLR